MRDQSKKSTKTIIAIIIFSCFFVSAISAQIKTSKVSAQKVEKQLAETASAVQAGDLTRAKTLLQEILSISPRSVEANTLAGFVADKENDLVKAEKHFAAAARLAPNSPATRNNYGAILVRLQRSAEAAREFAASLRLNPDQPSALVNLAQIQFAANDLTAARESFKKANVITPDAEISRSLILISLRLNEKEQAKSEFREYRELSKKNGFSSFDAAFSEALLIAGLAAEAQMELESAANPITDVKTLVLLARVYLEQKNIRAAGKLLESAIAGGTADARIYATLADVYQAGGYIENAIPAMRLAIENEPGNDFYQARYGLLLINSKAPAAAVIRMTEAAKKYPRSAKINFILGVALFGDGRSIEAEAAFRNTLKIEPRFVPALAYLGTVFAERGQYDEAASYFGQALKIEEANAILHYLLADTLLRMQTGDSVQIQKHLERAIQLDQTIAGAHLALGQLLARSNNWIPAIERFERAIALEPESAEAHYQLGRALARVKRMEESKNVLEKFKKLNEAQAARRETDRKELVRRLADVRF